MVTFTFCITVYDLGAIWNKTILYIFIQNIFKTIVLSYVTDSMSAKSWGKVVRWIVFCNVSLTASKSFRTDEVKKIFFSYIGSTEENREGIIKSKSIFKRSLIAHRMERNALPYKAAHHCDCSSSYPCGDPCHTECIRYPCYLV